MSNTPAFAHDTFISPFTWRYGSQAMRQLWSEEHKRRLLRRVWVALARGEMTAGLVTPAQVADLEAHMEQVDIGRAQEIEAPFTAVDWHVTQRPQGEGEGNQRQWHVNPEQGAPVRGRPVQADAA